jgi:hypothetical protein
VAVGNSGTILTTGDGGADWAVRSSGTSLDLFGVSCPSATQCFAVGGHDAPGVLVTGVVLASSDGGTTWSVQPAVSTRLLGISCPTAGTTCYAVNDQGVIFASTNGGEWSQEARLDEVLNGISCAGAVGNVSGSYQCVAVGSGGAVVSKQVVSNSIGAGRLTPLLGSTQAGNPTTFVLTWTVPSPGSWRDLRNLDLRLSDRTGLGLWARFSVGMTSTFGLLDEVGNLAGVGLPGITGTLVTNDATLDLAHSSFKGTGPKGPSVTVTFTVSFKPPAAGRVYATDLLATDMAGHVQGPEQVGTFSVGPFHLWLPEVLR